MWIALKLNGSKFAVEGDDEALRLASQFAVLGTLTN
jgi:hypothetical protein